jgi:hypothetical protein
MEFPSYFVSFQVAIFTAWKSKEVEPLLYTPDPNSHHTRFENLSRFSVLIRVDLSNELDFSKSINIQVCFGSPKSVCRLEIQEANWGLRSKVQSSYKCILNPGNALFRS